MGSGYFVLHGGAKVETKVKYPDSLGTRYKMKYPDPSEIHDTPSDGVDDVEGAEKSGRSQLHEAAYEAVRLFT